MMILDSGLLFWATLYITAFNNYGDSSRNWTSLSQLATAVTWRYTTFDLVKLYEKRVQTKALKHYITHHFLLQKIFSLC